MAGKSVKTGGGGTVFQTPKPPLKGSNSTSPPGAGVVKQGVRPTPVGGRNKGPH